MTLPKGITAKHAWLIVGLTVLMLWMILLFSELVDAKNYIALLLLFIPLAFGPLTWLLVVLRERNRLASQANGELLLELRDKERKVARFQKANNISELTGITIWFSSTLFCIGLLAYQCYMYLRYGEWIPRGWADMGLPILQTDWIGLQNILIWVAQGNTGFLVLVGGFIIGWLCWSGKSSTYHEEVQIVRLRDELKQIDQSGLSETVHKDVP